MHLNGADVLCSYRNPIEVLSNGLARISEGLGPWGEEGSRQEVGGASAGDRVRALRYSFRLSSTTRLVYDASVLI